MQRPLTQGPLSLGDELGLCQATNFPEEPKNLSGAALDLRHFLFKTIGLDFIFQMRNALLG